MVHARCIALAALSYSICGQAFVLRPRVASAHVITNRPHRFVGLNQRPTRSRRVLRTRTAVVVALAAEAEGYEGYEGYDCAQGLRSTEDALSPYGEAGAAKTWDIRPAGVAAAAAGVALAGGLLHPELANAADSFAGGLQMPVVMSQLLADPVASLAANPEWTRYAFMFPAGILVATCAQTAGIGGAAIMGPFLLLGLPLLGPAYPLHSVAASVATAILSEAFGFSSGLFGYFRRGLIDAGSALPFILASLPACLFGALIVPYADERVLKALYAVFMLGLSVYLFLDEGSESLIPEECSVEELESGEMKAICTSEGKEYLYRKPEFGADSGLSTAFGGLMTGMLGVGIGEVVIPQLVKKNGVPLPVAAGTSVLVVFLNAVVAAGTQIGGIISHGGDDVPWNLIAFLVPGVVIGGQLAPQMQGRLSQKTMEKILAGVFGFVGATFATISVKSLLAIATASASVP